MYIELEIALFPDFLKCTSSNWLIKKNEKKIISTGIKDRKTIPQAITENILWYEVKVMLESNYTDLSLWFVNEWRKKNYKFSVFLWRALKVGKSASVGNVYFHLKKPPQGHVLGEWTNFKKKYFRTNYWTGKSVNLYNFYIEIKTFLHKF